MPFSPLRNNFKRKLLRKGESVGRRLGLAHKINKIFVSSFI